MVGGVGSVCANQLLHLSQAQAHELTSSFRFKPQPPSKTNLPKTSVTCTFRLKIFLVEVQHTAVNVVGWQLVLKLRANTSDPLFFRIQWTSNLRGISSLRFMQLSPSSKHAYLVWKGLFVALLSLWALGSPTSHAMLQTTVGSNRKSSHPSGDCRSGKVSIQVSDWRR